MSLTVHVIEASSPPQGTDCVSRSHKRHENTPPPRIDNLLLRLMENRPDCCFCGLPRFHFDPLGVFEPLLLRKKDFDGGGVGCRSGLTWRVTAVGGA